MRWAWCVWAQAQAVQLSHEDSMHESTAHCSCITCSPRRLEVEGNGFLYKQVRTGLAKRSPCGPLSNTQHCMVLAWWRRPVAAPLNVQQIPAWATACADRPMQAGHTSADAPRSLSLETTQVRHMTGALLAVGSGQLPAEAIAAALAAGGEARTGAERHAFRGWMVAEAKGLCLQRVTYAPASALPLVLPDD